MKNKKLLTAAASAALVAVVGIGATLAYFTDTDEVSNVVTMGHVDITLSEEEAGNIPGEGLTFDNVMPGDTLDKTPVITLNDDSQDAYVRMKMEIQVTSGDISDYDIEELRQGLTEDITGTDTGWYLGADGYYYYNQSLSAGEDVTFFDTVTIPGSWKNNTADGSFTIKLTAEAIQAANITPETVAPADGITMITAWPEADIEQYTPATE